MKLINHSLKPLIAPVVLGSLAAMLAACNAGSNTANATGNNTTESYCTDTTGLAFEACKADAQETSLLGQAVCGNIDDETERTACVTEQQAVDAEEQALCGEQMAARNGVCTLLGEARYDPEIDPVNFVDPLMIGSGVAENAYFPLIPGLKRVYESEDETITVTVLDETVEIEGVTCIVVHDVVESDGELIEDTLDWYAQDLDGNVWYFGEIAKNYEDGELVDIDGSWKHGADGAKAGILMKAMPQVGDVYRQEWLLGEAEDMAEVVSTTAAESAPAATCAGDCLQTHEFTAIEPDVSESKFYAPGIGPVVVFDDAEPDNREGLVEFSIEQL